MKKTVVAIQHAPYEDLGNLAPILEKHQFDIQYLYADKDDLTIDPLKPDLLIVLGGPMGVYEQKVYPFLTQEINLLKTRLEADLPTLGICLGSQLMAAALGANVYQGPVKEVGWSSIALSSAGQNSALALMKGPVLHWHGDTFELPQGAIHLASSDLYQNQAFLIGKYGLALQFHPEITAGQLEHWLDHATEVQTWPEINWQQIRRDTQLNIQKSTAQSSELWDRWLADWFKN